MDIKTLKERLLALDGEVQDIFREIGHENKFRITNTGVIQLNSKGTYERNGIILKKDDVVESVCMDEDEKKLYWYPLCVSDRKIAV